MDASDQESPMMTFRLRPLRRLPVVSKKLSPQKNWSLTSYSASIFAADDAS